MESLLRLEVIMWLEHSTQVDLAARACVSTKHINIWLKGKTNLSVAVLERITEAVGMKWELFNAN